MADTGDIVEEETTTTSSKTAKWRKTKTTVTVG